MAKTAVVPVTASVTKPLMTQAAKFSQKFSQMTRITYLALLALALVAAVIGLYPVFVMKLLCFALFACAFNLLLGFTGLLSFGHAAFFGMAAYVAGYAAKSWGVTPELSLLLGMLAGAALGFVIGSIAIRRQGIYF